MTLPVGRESDLLVGAVWVGMSEELTESPGGGWSQRPPGLRVGKQGYDLPDVVMESPPARCCFDGRLTAAVGASACRGEGRGALDLAWDASRRVIEPRVFCSAKVGTHCGAKRRHRAQPGARAQRARWAAGVGAPLAPGYPSAGRRMGRARGRGSGGEMQPSGRGSPTAVEVDDDRSARRSRSEHLLELSCAFACCPTS
jgi:hypothetical protein